MRRIIFGGLIAACLAFSVFPASSASAHAVLQSSIPVASSTIPSSPPDIVLRFNEPVASTLAQIQLFDSEGKLVSIGRTARDSRENSVVRASLPTLSEGVYVVVWRVTSGDGHPVQGAFPFEVGEVSTGISTDILNDIVSRLGKPSTVGIGVGVFRFVAFVGFLLLVGAMVVSGGGELLRAGALLRIAVAAIALLILGTSGNLLLQGSYAVRGTWADVTNWGLVADVLHTRLGLLLAVRLALCACIAVGVWSLRRWSEQSGLRQSVATIGSIALLATFSASGHASALSYSLVSVVVDGVHLASVSAWIGGLFVLTLMSRRGFLESTEVRGENVVARFSRYATYLLPVAIVTGVFSALRIVDSWSGISDSTYGRLLVLKVSLVLVVTTLGSIARVAVKRSGPGSIRRGIVVEAVLGVLVLALTSGIVALSPSESSGASAVAHVTLFQNDILADITFAPLVIGPAEVHVVFTPPDNSLTPFAAVSARLSLPERGVPPIPIQMVAIDNAHWTGSIQVPYPGKWVIEVLASPTPASQVSFRTTIRIKG